MVTRFYRYRNIRGAVLMALAAIWAIGSGSAVKAQQQIMIVRISEIEVAEEHLAAYTAILTEEAEASVRLEKGVIAIFPMAEKTAPTKIRILEMYADKAAYESHLKTAHFLKYKSGTLHMVKSLKLIDMHELDAQAAGTIFLKMKKKG